MSRRGPAGAPTDEQLLAALDRLVAVKGIVKASQRLGVSYRTASSCHESRHVGREMRGVLHKYAREHGNQDQAKVDVAREDPVPTLAAREPRAGEEARLQEPEQDLRRAVELLRTEVADFRQRLEAVEDRAAPGWRSRHDGIAVEGVDAADGRKQQRSVPAPLRVAPELITEEAEPGGEQVYGAAAELVVEWREAWAVRQSARHTLARLRAERRRLELELRLIGVFGLTPPPADAPWREGRREQELDWRRKAIRRLCWQLPLARCLHGLLRGLRFGRWRGR